MKFEEYIVDKVPEGYQKTHGTTTQPIGYSWYNNGESRFSGKRKSVLVKDGGKDELN